MGSELLLVQEMGGPKSLLVETLVMMNVSHRLFHIFEAYGRSTYQSLIQAQWTLRMLVNPFTTK